MHGVLIDSDWGFLLDAPEAASSPHFDDSGWRRLDLPHDWSIELDRRSDAPSGGRGGFFLDGVGWYRKHLDLPTDWRGRHVEIEFEGVYRDAEVWCNGHYLLRHPYGYTTFHVDLSRSLRPGQKNVLAVRVDNSTHQHTRWYSGSGIYRHVRLLVGGPVHIGHWGTWAATPEVSANAAVVRLSTPIRNETDADVRATVGWQVLGPDGEETAAGTASVTVPAEGCVQAAASLAVAAPRLWSPETPSLYRIRTELRLGDAVADRSEDTFGIRSFRFTPAEGFVLNGRRLSLRGGCVHHDCGPLGAASFDRAEERKVELLKAAGYNAVRCAHNPPSRAFLAACDRLGMLVVDEAFDVWRAPKLPYDYHRHFDDWWRRDLDSMLLRDRNRPSIILWSIGNELVERALPEGAEIARKLAARVREIDPTRPVTAGICNVWDGQGEWRDTDALLDALDVCGYNYRLDVYESDHERRPSRVVVATESFPPLAFEYWQAVEKFDFLAGDFVWTALDYLGEAGIGRTYLEGEQEGHLPGYPWNQANCGDIDLCGFKRPQSHYRDVLWGVAKGPWIGVHPPHSDGRKVLVSPWGWHDLQPSWTWPGLEGRELQVDIYAGGDEVELFLNSRSLGRRPSGVAVRFIASFAVAYEPGELRVVEYAAGRPVAESALTTAGTAERIGLQADRECLRAGPNDLAYITVEVLDAARRRVPTEDRMVYFTLRGPGRIAAVANADPRNTEPYRGNCHRVWRGRGLVIVQPTGAPGVIVLQAQADGVVGTEVRLRVEVGTRD
ncbi:MAG: glycoside hydrolase family 2 protein [Kiritimatiellaeota bacterium]|nr:glycoside hydrolase family 2 protein [Kiritimatiellota bacterium]